MVIVLVIYRLSINYDVYNYVLIILIINLMSFASSSCNKIFNLMKLMSLIFYDQISCLLAPFSR